MGDSQRSHHYVLDHIRKVMYRKRGRDRCKGCGFELVEGDEVTRTRTQYGNYLWHTSCREKTYIDLPDMEASQ